MDKYKLKDWLFFYNLKDPGKLQISFNGNVVKFTKMAKKYSIKMCFPYANKK